MTAEPVWHPTPEEAERVVTLLFDPPWLYRLTSPIVRWLYDRAANLAGFASDEPRLRPAEGPDARLTHHWPIPSRILDWIGCRLDDLGFWANRRKARRRRG